MNREPASSKQNASSSSGPKHAPGSKPGKTQRLIIWLLMVVLIIVVMCLKK